MKGNKMYVTSNTSFNIEPQDPLMVPPQDHEDRPNGDLKIGDQVRLVDGCKSTVWKYARLCYTSGWHCDLAVFGSDLSRPVRCHQLVVAAASPYIKNILQSMDKDGATDEEGPQLFLPDYQYNEIKSVIDLIYGNCGGKLVLNKSLMTLMGLDFSSAGLPKQHLTLHSGSDKGCPSNSDKLKSGGRLRIKLSIPQDRGVKVNYDELKDLVESRGRLRVKLHRVSKYKYSSWVSNISGEKRILIGVRSVKNSKSVVKAFILCHDHGLIPNRDIASQYFKSCEALRSVYGFSKRDMYYYPDVVDRMGLEAEMREFRKEAKAGAIGACRNLTVERLRLVLADSDMYKVTESNVDQPRTLPPLRQMIVLSFTDSMEPSEMEGIGLLRFFDGGANKRFLQMFESSKQEAQSLASLMNRLLANLLLDDGGLRIERSQEISDHYRNLISSCETYNIVQDLLSNSTTKNMSRKVTETKFQCQKCDFSLTINSNVLQAKANAHMKKHFVEETVCNCDVDKSTYKKREEHVLLHHTNGQYVPCSHCGKVFALDLIKTHEYDSHTERGRQLRAERRRRQVALYVKSVCDICGGIYRSEYKLQQHIQRMHTKLKCDYCEEMLPGPTLLFQHKKKHHLSEFKKHIPTCSTCGRTYVSQKKLELHYLRVHATDKERPHKCGQCGKGFTLPCEVKYHIAEVHDRKANHVCRHGCGAAYRNQASRYCHERKEHGFIMGKKNASLPH